MTVSTWNGPNAQDSCREGTSLIGVKSTLGRDRLKVAARMVVYATIERCSLGAQTGAGLKVVILCKNVHLSSLTDLTTEQALDGHDQSNSGCLWLCNMAHSATRQSDNFPQYWAKGNCVQAMLCLPPFGRQMGAVLFLLLIDCLGYFLLSRRGETVRVRRVRISAEIRHCPPNGMEINGNEGKLQEDSGG